MSARKKLTALPPEAALMKDLSRRTGAALEASYPEAWKAFVGDVKSLESLQDKKPRKPLPKKTVQHFKRRLEKIGKPFTVERTILNGAVRVVMTNSINGYGELDGREENLEYLPGKDANKALKSLLEAVARFGTDCLDCAAEEEDAFNLDQEPKFLQKVEELDAVAEELFSLEEEQLYWNSGYRNREPFCAQTFIDDILS